MERRIGEIFEYNGEWFQCVEQPEKYDKTVCNLCDFHGIGNCELDRCSGTYRSDKKDVVFKKLERIGEQFLYKGKQMQSYRRATDALICNWNNSLLLLEHGDSDIIDIEIKQNKEDMEEYKMYDAKEDIPEFDKVVDECLFGKQKLKLKPFDLQKAKEGKPVCTRDGRSVRILCFDAKREKSIVALVSSKEKPGFEDLITYPNNGNYHGGHENDGDLMMLPEKKEGWVNVYNNPTTHNIYTSADVFESKEIAEEQGTQRNRIATCKITWEE